MERKKRERKKEKNIQDNVWFNIKTIKVAFNEITYHCQ